MSWVPGFLCLSRLETRPVDVLKIDRLFIRVITVRGGAAPLVDAILQLARVLGFSVIVEGIEREHQRQRLLDLGCLKGQGYHLGRPESAASIYALLAAQAAPATQASVGAPA